MIIDGLDMTEAFALIGNVPDCRLPEDNSIHYGHRTLGDQEIYFLSNQTEDIQLVTPEFRSCRHAARTMGSDHGIPS